MSYREEAVCFRCAGEQLIGILARPEHPAKFGIVIVVGGPQTRVGSHRQFVLLSRQLAAAGIATLRFDYRGMGDSTGQQRDFEAVGEDIASAIDALQSACPGVGRIVLWGLCDAAAASLLYWNETRDRRVAGFCLLNPWVRSETTLARTQVKHYYGQRLRQKEFWLKLLSGKLNVLQSLVGLLGKLRQASTTACAASTTRLGFQDRMAGTLRDFHGPILILLSEKDYTAKEFLEYVATAESWRDVLARPNLTRVEIPGADHTFSSMALRETAAVTCLAWLQAQGFERDLPPATQLT